MNQVIPHKRLLSFLVLLIVQATVILSAPTRVLAQTIFHQTFDNDLAIQATNGVRSGSYGTGGFVSGRKANAMRFTGTHYYTFPRPGPLDRGTLEFWIKPVEDHGIPVLVGGLIESGVASTPNSLGLFTVSEQFALELNVPGSLFQGVAFPYPNRMLPEMRWTHVAAVWNCSEGDNSISLYVNGIGQSTIPSTCPLTITSPSMLIGTAGLYKYAYAVLDEVKIFALKKSAVQIQTENAPLISRLSPSTESIILPNVSTIQFRVSVSDPNSDPTTVHWIVNGDSLGTGNTIPVHINRYGLNTVVAEVSDGAFVSEMAWNVILQALPGDTNNDYCVTSADLAVVRINLGMASGATLQQGDLDGDGDVDGNDMLVWQRNVGKCVSPVSVSDITAAIAPENADNSIVETSGTIDTKLFPTNLDDKSKNSAGKKKRKKKKTKPRPS